MNLITKNGSLNVKYNKKKIFCKVTSFFFQFKYDDLVKYFVNQFSNYILLLTILDIRMRKLELPICSTYVDEIS